MLPTKIMGLLYDVISRGVRTFAMENHPLKIVEWEQYLQMGLPIGGRHCQRISTSKWYASFLHACEKISIRMFSHLIFGSIHFWNSCSFLSTNSHQLTCCLFSSPLSAYNIRTYLADLPLSTSTQVLFSLKKTCMQCTSMLLEIHVWSLHVSSIVIQCYTC